MIPALLAGIARTAGTVLARKGAKSLSEKLKPFTQGQTVFETPTLGNARDFTKAMRGGSGREVASAKESVGTTTAADVKAKPPGAKENRDTAPSDSQSRPGFFDRAKNTIGLGREEKPKTRTMQERYDELQSSGALKSKYETAKEFGTPSPSQGQQVEFSEQEDLKAKHAEEKQKQEEEKKSTQSLKKLAGAFGGLATIPVSFFAVGRSLKFFGDKVEAASDGLGMFSAVIGSQQRMSEVHGMMMQMRTAQGTQGTFSELASQNRNTAEQWQPIMEDIASTKNYIGAIASKFSGKFAAVINWFMDNHGIRAVLDDIEGNTNKKDELVQQDYRDYLKSIMAGSFTLDIEPPEAEKPAVEPVKGVAAGNDWGAVNRRKMGGL